MSTSVAPFLPRSVLRLVGNEQIRESVLERRCIQNNPRAPEGSAFRSE
jgi:hypothetical protein